MKKLLFIVLFGVLALGCENLLPNEQSPNSKTIFVTDSNDAYIFEVAGGKLVVTITTNVGYSVVIPEEAKSWLSVADTRAEARMEKQTFIIAENDTFETRLANVEFVDSSGKVLKSILFSQKCDDKVFTTDAEGNYIVIAEGGEVQVAVTTNLEYSVAIPEAAQEWLSVADTRVEIREETLIFIVAENKESEERSASIELVDNNGNLLQTVEFIQLAAGVCPSNEIWYTSADGNIVEPYSGDGSQDNFTVFGANIVSNKYDADKDCWVITFDGDITSIGEGAFCECSSLTSVTIGNSVTTIGQWAFAYCSSLTEFRGKYASEDGRCLIIDGTLNSFAPAGLTEYNIPDIVTTIGGYAFFDCSSLTSITIPDSVTTIGAYAFSGCVNLPVIDNIRYADTYLVEAVDTSQISYAIKEGTRFIGDFAFYGCSSLTSVTIPDSVTIIGEGAFHACTRLTSIIIPDSVTTIGVNAFYNCSSLTSVTIGDSVTTIGEWAFADCSSLTSVTIGDSVTTIGGYAFFDCSSLTSVTIPDSVTSIGTSTFYGCSSLTSIYCKPTTPPAGGRCMFDQSASGCKIYVPYNSVGAYKSAENWSRYASAIVGYDF